MLRNNLYTEQFAPQILQAAASGTLTGTGQGRVASATHADYAAAAVAVLSGDGHEGKVYELGGDTSWSLPDLAVEISRAAGRDVVYQDVRPEQYRELLMAAGLPPIVADAALDTRRAIAEGEFEETSAVLSDLIGRPTTPLSDVVAAFLRN